MTPNYLFRKAESDDLDLLTQWTLELMQHEAVDDSLEVPLKPDIETKIENWLANLLKSDNALFIIAESEDNKAHGCILGLLQLAPNDFVASPIHGLIQMVWVTPEHRRHGLARQLLEHMEQTFRNLDVPYCEISYSVNNKEAKGFWLSNGYEPVSTTSRKFF